ncbi:NAD(P)-dependent dehydrogenase (short-subunit alcohol dehydrogenase family) [Pseudomonas sp. BS3782 TE3695]|uniref:SDR family oxidoreductase n=1 Tax=Pseudomonas sp. BS3782 TE3695 TaxID=3349323 RepID=UPI003D23D060
MFASNLLAGKKILITGGGTGLGKSIGQRFLELGAELVIAGRRKEVLDATAEEFRDALPTARVSTVQADVRDADSVEAMMEEVWRSGPLDVLMCNAAANFIARTETLSPRAVDAVLDIVLHGSFYCAIAAGKRWIAEGRAGNIISTVSTPAMTGSAFTAPSAAAKAGVLAMTRSLAVEWGPKGIRLNCVAPGLFPTPGAWEQLYPPGSQVEPQEKSVPLRRFGDHRELADLYSYLASEGSAYINGEMIVMDGGRWMQGVGGPSFRAMQDWNEDQWQAMRGKGRT